MEIKFNKTNTDGRAIFQFCEVRCLFYFKFYYYEEEEREFEISTIM